VQGADQPRTQQAQPRGGGAVRRLHDRNPVLAMENLAVHGHSAGQRARQRPLQPGGHLQLHANCF